jgi:hypothetical protein
VEPRRERRVGLWQGEVTTDLRAVQNATIGANVDRGFLREATETPRSTDEPSTYPKIVVLLLQPENLGLDDRIERLHRWRTDRNCHRTHATTLFNRWRVGPEPTTKPRVPKEPMEVLL